MRTQTSTRKGERFFAPTIRSLARLWLVAILIITACGEDGNDDAGSSSSIDDGGSSSSIDETGLPPICIYEEDRWLVIDNFRFCQWEDGCVAIRDEQDKGCDYEIDNCKRYGTLYAGVNRSALNKDNDYGEGLKCDEIGGYTAPVCCRHNYGADYSNGLYYWETNGRCSYDFFVKDDYYCDELPLSPLCKYNGDENRFCQWPNGCFALRDEDDGCSYEIDNCKKYGTLYSGIDLSLLNESNGYGEGLKCDEIGGEKQPTCCHDPSPTIYLRRGAYYYWTYGNCMSNSHIGEDDLCNDMQLTCCRNPNPPSPNDNFGGTEYYWTYGSCMSNSHIGEDDLCKNVQLPPTIY